MSSETEQAKVLVNAEFERRGLRRVLYLVLLAGIVTTFMGFADAPTIATLALVGLAASCQPVAD